MDKPLDIFDRVIKVGDFIIYPGRVLGFMNYGTVLHIYEQDGATRMSVRKKTDPNNIRTVHLSNLDRCAILDIEGIKERFHNGE